MIRRGSGSRGPSSLHGLWKHSGWGPRAPPQRTVFLTLVVLLDAPGWHKMLGMFRLWVNRVFTYLIKWPTMRCGTRIVIIADWSFDTFVGSTNVHCTESEANGVIYSNCWQKVLKPPPEGSKMKNVQFWPGPISELFLTIYKLIPSVFGDFDFRHFFEFFEVLNRLLRVENEKCPILTWDPFQNWFWPFISWSKCFWRFSFFPFFEIFRSSETASWGVEIKCPILTWTHFRIGFDHL